jgi:hypothetical protein
MALHVFVIKEAELEDPQDLRARSRKFLNLTNERKNMSTKTNFKRIALVAVAALGAGVLATAPASATDNAAAGATNAASAANLLNVATRTDAAAVVSTTVADNRSVGLLNNSTTLTTASLTSTATMLSTGTLVFYTTGVSDLNSSVVVSGGKITSFISTGSTAVAANQTAATAVLEDAAAVTSFAVTPDSGSTSMTVELYKNTSLADPVNTAGSLTRAQGIIAGTVSIGSLIQKYIVTVGTTSTVGAYSAADSLCNLGTSTSSAAATTDATGAGVIANGVNGYVDINLRDAFEGALTGAVIIEATGGAGLAYNGDYTATSAAADFNLVQVSTDANGKIDVARPAALANKSFSTTVTVKFNGVVACTKAIRFQGEVATITVNEPYIGRTGATNTVAFRTAFKDNGGFPLYPQSGVTAVSTTLNQYITSVDANATPPNATTGLRGKGSVTCAGTAGSYLDAGSANLQLQYINTTSGTTVKSNIWKHSCAGDPYSFTASLDKASYAPGSVAKVTITFKDAAGNLANNYADASTGTTTSALSITGLGTAVTAPADGDSAGDSGTDGTLEYQYVVGTTENSYTAVVAVPNASALSAQANVALAYEIKSNSTAVSNADVLKAIVSLIASINKQIAALQKALLKK